MEAEVTKHCCFRSKIHEVCVSTCIIVFQLPWIILLESTLLHWNRRSQWTQPSYSTVLAFFGIGNWGCLYWSDWALVLTSFAETHVNFEINFAVTYFKLKTFRQIRWHPPMDMLISSTTSLTKIRRKSIIIFLSLFRLPTVNVLRPTWDSSFITSSWYSGIRWYHS